MVNFIAIALKEQITITSLGGIRTHQLTLSFIMLSPRMQSALLVSWTPPTPYLTYSHDAMRGKTSHNGL